jgi:hypothetical protein
LTGSRGSPPIERVLDVLGDTEAITRLRAGWVA